MSASDNTTFIDARHSSINITHGDQHNYHDGSLTGLAPGTTSVLDHILINLQPATMDDLTRSECLEGTRKHLLHFIKDWASRPSVERILWLHGLAGSGKSTIATTIANYFNVQNCLGASLFFSRDVEERSQPSIVIRTLAYQLGMSDTRIATAIATAINTTSRITQLPLDRQFRKLLVEPLSSFATSATPIVVVLDALDECGNAKDRKSLLATLVTESTNLPPSIRIIVTSRKESDIMAAFMAKPHVLAQELDLTSPENKEAIMTFLVHQMSSIRSDNSSLLLSSDWPGDDKIHALAERAEGLFIWASTACLFLEGHDPPKRLNVLLHGGVDANPESSLDSLYATALESAGRWDDEDFRSDFHSIMGVILVARNPLPDKAIDTLLHLEQPSRHTISRLECVLHWADGKPLRILHRSFADFLSNRLRCGEKLYVDVDLHNKCLALQTINHLNTVLRRNICDLTLSQAPVTTTLLETTSYASTFWIDHVIDMTEVAKSFADALEEFLFRHLLHWLEAMSILKMSREAITSLSSLLIWVKTYVEDHSNLRDLIYDGYRFAHLFAPLMEQHPLLIYQSALPFTPTSTILYRTFHPITSGVLRVAGRCENYWSPQLMVLAEHHGQAVHSVTITPNGAYIIAGLADGSIGIWDAVSGAEAYSRLQGHIGSIHSIACTPDGKLIASGSDDSTIRLWDIRSSTEVSVLEGHTSRVTSVCFAPHCSTGGMPLLSGSRDCTVRLWDASSERVSHCNSWINTIAFSPDGQRYVSGAADGTVRVQDTASGAEVLMLSTKTSVQSVAFSPDGRWLVSGSTDKTIRIWNAKLGTLAFQPLRSHEQSKAIRTLVFLPNGKRIVAGADNGTIRVWDYEQGTEDRPPLREHTRPVEAVIVSHDGRRIISGSKDHSIRIWDADYSAIPLETEDPPSLAVTVLALSYDGAYFATGLKDKTIHLRNTITGAEMSDPLKGHTDLIRSLSFSPDGRKIASGADTKEGSIRIWDTTVGNQKLVLRRRDMGGTLSLAFSSDGRRIVSGSTDNIIRIWEPWSNGSNKLTLSLEGHDDEVICIAFSPDGTQIVSGSKDCTVRVWDAKSGAQISLPFKDHGSKSYIRSVAFSSDALLILSQSFVHKVVQKWSTTGASWALLSKTKSNIHRTSRLLDPFALTSDGWIIDTLSGKKVSKLPPNISILSVMASAASNASLVIAMDRGRVAVMHFQENNPMEANTL